MADDAIDKTIHETIDDFAANCRTGRVYAKSEISIWLLQNRKVVASGFENSPASRGRFYVRSTAPPDWGTGGTYRQIATALVAGVRGNVVGAGGEFAQNMVVNYVQQQGAGYIGKLVEQGESPGNSVMPFERI